MVDKQYLIDTNVNLLERWNNAHPKDYQPLGVRGEINDIILLVEQYDKSNNRIGDLIRKASYIMTIVSWVQAFWMERKEQA